MIVASAVNEEGDALYPRKWNNHFIDLPEDKNPKQPTLTGDVVTAIVGTPKRKLYRMFYTLCASAGLRFGEALGIDIKNISPDCTTIKICQKAWRGQIHDYLKSDSGKRDIDLHPMVAAMLKDSLVRGSLVSCSPLERGYSSRSRTSCGARCIRPWPTSNSRRWAVTHSAVSVSLGFARTSSPRTSSRSGMATRERR